MEGKKKLTVIAKNISKYRKLKAKLTQSQLAEKIGDKIYNIGAYEEGRAKVPSDKIVLIADALGLTLDELMREEIIITV